MTNLDSEQLSLVTGGASPTQLLQNAILAVHSDAAWVKAPFSFSAKGRKAEGFFTTPITVSDTPGKVWRMFNATLSKGRVKNLKIVGSF